jgi:Uma2 family endonuclease
MANLMTIPMPVTLPSGEIVAVGVSAEDYMEHYAADFYEWVDGVVIKLSPVTTFHNALFRHFLSILQAYFALNPIGKLQHAPFVMRVDETKSRREPDLQIILNSNMGNFTDTAMIGAADICIEIVSPESVARDFGDKLLEYERGGVKEYWIIDPLHKECRFHRLNENGIYQTVSVDNLYETPLLPQLKLDIEILWRNELPNIFQVAEAVKAMFD